MTLQENDVVLCTVKRIEGTTVFLEIEENGEGTMIFSEVSPGRIRNIREYVAPGKKVVCKILRIKDGHPQLSLRRVTAKEREEVLDRHKKEKMFTNMVKPVLKDKAQKTIDTIKKEYDIADFLDDAREDQKLLEKFMSKKEAEELYKIIAERREKEKVVKKQIKVTSQSASGLNDVKEILDVTEVDIYYLGSSKFTIEIKANDYKTANHKLEEIIEELKERAKKRNAKIEVK